MYRTIRLHPSRNTPRNSAMHPSVSIRGGQHRIGPQHIAVEHRVQLSVGKEHRRPGESSHKRGPPGPHGSGPGARAQWSSCAASRTPAAPTYPASSHPGSPGPPPGQIPPGPWPRFPPPGYGIPSPASKMRTPSRMSGSSSTSRMVCALMAASSFYHCFNQSIPAHSCLFRERFLRNSKDGPKRPRLSPFGQRQGLFYRARGHTVPAAPSSRTAAAVPPSAKLWGA